MNLRGRKEDLAGVLIAVGVFLSVASWATAEESPWLSSFSLEIGATFLLLAPGVYLTRLFEEKVEQSEARPPFAARPASPMSAPRCGRVMSWV
jgi:hypothetical protein